MYMQQVLLALAQSADMQRVQAVRAGNKGKQCGHAASTFSMDMFPFKGAVNAGISKFSLSSAEKFISYRLGPVPPLFCTV
jgi:hypothetical protein